ncbi:hypothetical protein [Modicisalibacter luteus]|uniref:hypothetical protein n=1 Tax=Modicisalibacter luteus TaxID=453962 RepID=UPI0027E4443E|nr:hypothetical protein [Halomonas lutea]
MEQPHAQRIRSILLHRCEFFSDINPLEIVEECQAGMREQFRHAHELGLLVPHLSPDTASRLLQSTLSGLIHDWLRNPQRFSLQEEGSELINALFRLLRYEP